jgi:hypothetical protein
MISTDFDYSIFYKKKYSTPDELKVLDKYDLFISAFNDSYRVRQVFEDIIADEKHWLVFPEYDYSAAEWPTSKDSTEKIFVFDANLKEGDIIRDYFSKAGVDLTKINKICVDITGFIRPHLIFFVRYCYLALKEVDFIYTDPIKYKKKEHTDFSFDYVDVRQIDGCQGVHNPETNNDVLIIGSGYDHLRITDVSKKKNNSKKIQLFGFPSLQPDMYQENILKAYKAEEETSNGRENFIDKDRTIFAPANDPFVTANVIRDFVLKENKKLPITNLYLCPLSTKAQTLGLALYYVSQCIDKPVSIIFPVCNRYSKETTEGISKIWKFTVEFDCLRTTAALVV